MARTCSILTLAATAALLGACSGANPLNDSGDDLSAEMAQVALASDLLTEEIVDLELASMPSTSSSRTPVVDAISFDRTRPCPLGGELHVEGTIARTYDPDTGVLELEVQGTRTRTDCAFAVRATVVTVDGSSSWEKFRRRLNGVPDGLQTSRYAGSWTAVADNGHERSCTFDYTVVRDPSDRTVTVEGQFCAHRFRHRDGWNPNG